jgi:hypothetical protein
VAPPSVEEFNSFTAVSRQCVCQQSQQSAGRMRVLSTTRQATNDNFHAVSTDIRQQDQRRREEEQHRRDDDQHQRDDERRDLMAMFQVALSAHLHGANPNGCNGSNNNN